VTDFPVRDILPELLAALRDGTRALLVAPPGAGKTTMVAPALLDQQWATDGQVLLLVPRRLAARAAAEFIASRHGEKAGETFGYATRLDSKVGKATRVVAMTHGVFLARIQADPELKGVAAVLFDEVHERSLDNDLALAFALDAAEALRPDLRIVAMSATMDGARFSTLLGDPPRIVSEGKAHPLSIEYVGRDPGARIEPQMAAAIRRALLDHQGSLLAFLPGVAEIERTADALGPLPENVVLHRLHGAVEPAAQRAALAPPPSGQRKLVLASAIAETSLTLDDVRIVVDSGLARRPRYDRGAGLTRGAPERPPRAAVIQRAGRAARQGPGIAIRLWEEAATASLPAQDPPEILEADLSALLIACLVWGEADPARLPFLDPPSPVALAEARRRLTTLGALDDAGHLTTHGRAIAAWPLEPRLAHMMIEAGERGMAGAAAGAAALLTERGLGGNDPDLELRWRRWRSDKGPRAAAARRLAENWARRAGGSGHQVHELGRALALAFPDRLSRRRDANGEHWQSVGGRGFRLDPASPLARSQWLAVAEVAGHASGARILSAAAIDEQDVIDMFGERIQVRHDGAFDPATGSVTPTRTRRLGAIRLSSGPDPDPDQKAIEAALIEGVRGHGPGMLPWTETAVAFRDRAAFARNLDSSIPAIDDEALVERIDDWLPQLVAGKRGLKQIASTALRSALDALLGYDAVRSISRLAPAEFATPAGSSHPIDYGAPGGPAVEVRAQALYGLSEHPMIGGGRVPLTLAITSPAHRPIQTTKDLPAFWSGSWREVAKEMRGRYPKHPWPDDPASAAATLRTKKAGGNPRS
jgi:ATP-dependent helicase HrpB